MSLVILFNKDVLIEEVGPLHGRGVLESGDILVKKGILSKA
jgi:hypothetical protein